MPTIKMPTPVKRSNSQYYWIRKKVPERYRPLVGKREVWKSLETADRRQATVRLGAVNAAIEADWARLANLTTNLNEEKAANAKLNTVALRKGVNAKASTAA